MRILEHELERGKELKELLEKLILNGKTTLNLNSFFFELKIWAFRANLCR